MRLDARQARTSVVRDFLIGRHTILSPYAAVNSSIVLCEEAFLRSHVTVTDGGRLDDSARMGANVAVHLEVPPPTLAHGVPPSKATVFVPGKARLVSKSAVSGSASHQERPDPAP